MLEIILIVIIFKKIAPMITEKGRSPAGYIVAFVVLWIGGELVGVVVGTIIAVAYINSLFMVPIFAVLGAAVGGTIGYLIANSVPPLDDPRRKALQKFDDDDDRERERWRRRHDDDKGEFEDTDTYGERERRRRRQDADEGKRPTGEE
jgi:membrane protein DedA with SNARE-associated domain